MIRKLDIEGYRSIRDLTLKLAPVNVLTGPNGCGKSNLYNSLVLHAASSSVLKTTTTAMNCRSAFPR